MNRRDFVTIAGVSAASRAHSANEPSIIIDTHAHFYDPSRPGGVPWPGNWPVSERIAPYEIVFKVVHDYFTSKGQMASEKYFWQNARTAYKWNT